MAVIWFFLLNLILRQAIVSSLELKSDIGDIIQIPSVLEYDSTVNYRFIDNEAARNNVGKKMVQCYVITQCSVDRLPNLKRLALSWNGLISVGVYTSSIASEKDINLQLLDEFVSEMSTNNNFLGQIHISVLFGREDKDWYRDDILDANITEPLYPVNALRNLAVAAVPHIPVSSSTAEGLSSPLLFLLDVDFRPSPGLGPWVTNNFQKLMEHCLQGQLFVVPAFELDQERYRKHINTSSGELDFKRDVESAVFMDVVEPFHFSKFPPGHGPTDFPRFQTSLK